MRASGIGVGMSHPKYRIPWRGRKGRISKPPRAEAAVLQELEARGFQFNREYPVEGGRFFIDIYFKGERVGVEIDGPEHDHKKEADTRRDAEVSAKNILVLRFKNREALEETSRVVDKIEETLFSRQSMRLLPSSLPREKWPVVKFDRP